MYKYYSLINDIAVGNITNFFCVFMLNIQINVTYIYELLIAFARLYCTSFVFYYLYIKIKKIDIRKSYEIH